MNTTRRPPGLDVLLPAWLRLLALSGDLGKAVPSALRYRIPRRRSPASRRQAESGPANP